MTTHIETTRFFKMATALSAAQRSGDIAAAWEAADDLEVLAMHTGNPKLRDRATAMVAAEWIQSTPSAN